MHHKCNSAKHRIISPKVEPRAGGYGGHAEVQHNDVSEGKQEHSHHGKGSSREKRNGKVAKPGAEVKVNDILEIRFGNRVGRYRIAEVKEVVRKEGAADMYEVLEEDAQTKAERSEE